MLQRQLAGKFNADNFEFVLDNEHFDKKLSMEDSLLVTALSMAHSVAFSTAHNVPHLHPHHRKRIYYAEHNFSINDEN